MSEVVEASAPPIPDIPSAERSIRTNALFARIEETADDSERDALREAVAELNLGIVRGLARRYRGRGESIEDLEQAGCVGLMKAIRGFRTDRGTEFLTYAVPTISGELKKHFRDRSWTVRPTRRIQDLQAEVASATASMTQELGREPSLAELAAELGEDTDALREAIVAHGCYSPRSLDAPLPTGDSALWAMLGREEDGFAQTEVLALLGAAVRKLPERDRQILGLRFFRDLTQREIAAELGTTQMQVSRMLTRIMAKLREEIAPAAIA